MLNLEEIAKKERIRLGMSQKKLADEAGVTQRSVAYWESGKRKMSVENADRVFQALHLTVTIGERK